MSILEELLKWEQQMGGIEAPVWQRLHDLRDGKLAFYDVFEFVQELGYSLGFHVSESGAYGIEDVFACARALQDGPLTLTRSDAIEVLRNTDSDYLRDCFYENIREQTHRRLNVGAPGQDEAPT